ncbi:hypothetical protein B1218_34445 [Pseudomonas ogarae]|nr:hypothetical protein B1218_34445 [Pseudomonas ogarae]
MKHRKAARAEETHASTCEDNDREFSEDRCKRRRGVAHVADRAASMGGLAGVERGNEPKQRYGRVLYWEPSQAACAGRAASGG